MARTRTYTLWLLLLVYCFNIIDRKILTIMQEPIKAEFHLADWQLGLLTGFAFALLYSVVGLPVARLADGGMRRVSIIAVSLAAWSGMTALCGAAQNYTQLLLARVGVGIGEAGCSPPSLSLLADHYPRAERGRAMGIYALGLPIGTALGLSLGGLLAQSFGWRIALLAVGAPGLILALLIRLTLAEPARTARPDPTSAEDPAQAKVPLGEALRILFAKPTYVLLLIAGSFGAFCSLGLQFWFPSFFIRSFGIGMAQVGMWWGLAAGAAGLLGTFGGGWLADRFGARHPRYILMLPAVALLIGMPFQILAATADNFLTALLFLLVPTATNMMWMAPNMMLTQSLAPVRVRAMSSAISTFITNIVGMGIGPLALGLASDWFGRHTSNPAQGLSLALVAVSAIYIPAAIAFLLASRSIARDLED